MFDFFGQGCTKPSGIAPLQGLGDLEIQGFGGFGDLIEFWAGLNLAVGDYGLI